MMPKMETVMEMGPSSQYLNLWGEKYTKMFLNWIRLPGKKWLDLRSVASGEGYYEHE